MKDVEPGAKGAIFTRERDSGLSEAALGPTGSRDRAGGIFVSFLIRKCGFRGLSDSILDRNNGGTDKVSPSSGVWQ